LRTRADAALLGDLAMRVLQTVYFFSDWAALRGPLRVRALVLVR
jgi:hypothetical protein